MIKNNLVKIQMIRMHIDSDEYNNNGDETIISNILFLQHQLSLFIQISSVNMSQASRSTCSHSL